MAQIHPVDRLMYVLSRCRGANALIIRKIVQRFEPTRIMAAHHFFEMHIRFELTDRFRMVGYSATLFGEPLRSVIPFITRLAADYDGYKYLMVPVTLNYGRKMNHQACYVFDLRRKKCLMYEPYGTYEKFGESYLGPFGHIPDQCGFRTTTWHREMGVPGIQTILIEKNKERMAEFERDMFERPPLTEEQTEMKKDDGTLETLYLVGHAEEGGDHQKIAEAYRLFGKYTSKSCVTLTIIDMYLMGMGIVNQFYVGADHAKVRATLWRIIVDLYGNLDVPELTDPHFSAAAVCEVLYPKKIA